MILEDINISIDFLTLGNFWRARLIKAPHPRLNDNTFPDRQEVRGADIAYSFKKGKSGSINHKVNLKTTSLVRVNVDAVSLKGEEAAQS